MPLETATHITQLVVTNPANSDGLNQADDHMRLIKSVLLQDIDNAMTDKKLTAVDGSSSVPSVGFSADATTGFYRSATGKTGIIGRLEGNGAVGVGSLHMFLVEPTGLGKGAVGTGHKYLELDGSTWPNASFPDLATHLGQGGTTFTLPNAYATGRFPRSRTAAVAAGTLQSNTVGPHTHPDVTKTTTVESVPHTHSGTTGAMNANASHTHTSNAALNSFGGGINGGGAFSVNQTGTGATINATNTDHGHPFTSGNPSVQHTHDVTVNTPANTGTTETRPEALSVVLCIKT
jgi:hypothetical protein